MGDNASSSPSLLADGNRSHIYISNGLNFTLVSNPGSLLARIAIIVTGSVIILFTIFGNLLVIVAVVNERQLRKVGNAYIVSLAISDVLVGMVISPLALMYELDGKWSLGRDICDMWVAMDVVCCTASIVNLCVISFDRYNAITRPMNYALLRTPKRAALSIMGVWMYSVIIAFPPFAGWRENWDSEINQTELYNVKDCSVYQGPGYTIFSTIGAFYLPLFVMMLLYGKIYTATRVRCKQWIAAPGYRHTVLSHRSSFIRKKNALAIESNSRLKTSENTKIFPIQINPGVGLRLGRQEDIRCYRRSGSLNILINKQCEDDEDTVASLPHRHSMTSSRRSVPRLSNFSSQRSTLSRMVSLQSSSGVTTDTTLSLGVGDVIMGIPDRRQSAEMTLQLPSTPPENRPSVGNTSAIVALCQSLSPIFGTKNDDSTDENETTDAQTQAQTQIHINVRRNIASSTTVHKRRRKNRISLAQEKRAARTLGVIMGCFVACWMPFFIVTLLTSFSTGTVPVIVTDIVLWLGYLNSAFNPAIYTFFNRDFRRAFRRLFYCTKSYRH